jgi:two-component system, LytTR family, sensor kinase
MPQPLLLATIIKDIHQLDRKMLRVKQWAFPPQNPALGIYFFYQSGDGTSFNYQLNASMNNRLTNRQIWSQALRLLVVYYPISVYLNLPGKNLDLVLPSLWFPGLVTLLLYFCWITIIEWLLDWLVDYFGEAFLMEFKFPAQLLAVPVAITAAISSHWLFVLAFRGMNWLKGKDMASHAAIEKWRQLNPAFWEHFERSNNALTVVIMLSVFYLAVNRRTNRRLQYIQVRSEQLEKEKVITQLTALRNQISPHFLFNSLSILSSLVNVDPNLSEQFIDQLSKAYRYILEQKDNDCITLKTELDFIASYAFLLKIRFEQKFSVQIQVSETDASRYAIAPLTLQLLVENAVKHNRMSKLEPLCVSVGIENDYLVVRNRIRRREQIEHSTGVGLQNIVNRYRLLTESPVEVGEQEGNFTVKIPLLLPENIETVHMALLR